MEKIFVFDIVAFNGKMAVYGTHKAALQKNGHLPLF